MYDKYIIFYKCYFKVKKCYIEKQNVFEFLYFYNLLLVGDSFLFVGVFFIVMYYIMLLVIYESLKGKLGN